MGQLWFCRITTPTSPPAGSSWRAQNATWHMRAALISAPSQAAGTHRAVWSVFPRHVFSFLSVSQPRPRMRPPRGQPAPWCVSRGWWEARTAAGEGGDSALQAPSPRPLLRLCQANDRVETSGPSWFPGTQPSCNGDLVNQQ